ncbi:MAG: aspartate carbamoyltransferase regulatory subunit [Clostridia bacterium]|nr:aspartate carbamoyltransferase regulatory subunit [Clostridia bacterium]
MNIDSIKHGVVIDHIKAGMGMEIYSFLGLDKLDCPVAIIKNASSRRMGKKDIIKVDTDAPLHLEALGYIDPEMTVNVIENGTRIKKYHPALPEQVVNIVKCNNPRCITSTEQELPHIFRLTDAEHRTYRCIYCESKAKN